MEPRTLRPSSRDGAISDGRYRTEKVLGHGGMATVFLGVDEQLDRPVAIKLLADNLCGDDGFRERFQLEARLAGKLSHPNIVQIFDVREHDGRPFIVMEYVAGETLSELLGRSGTIGEREAIELALQASAGLEHAHRARLVHRDVKPQNLLLREDGVLKIADFGIARAAEGQSLTETGTLLGTRPYVSPERERGEEAGPQADVYALGVVISEMVGGQAGPELVEIVSRCLEVEPERRYSSAAGLRGALAGIADSRLGQGAVVSLLRRSREGGSPGSAGADEAMTVQLSADEADADAPTPATGIPLDGTGPSQRRIEVPFAVGSPPQIRRRRSGWGSRTLLATLAAVAIAVVLAGVILVGSLGSGGGGSSKTAASVRRVAPPDLSGQPADQARSLARWLRAHSAR
ncbi:MAG: eukaryotic-like serine/threonine-protein kinase [Solirubrobacterales bacterium]|jgi:serine/threonine-protein kinase|nr:eukaryotic-like serine/threonine-protein kinase [Solirubrobacterales bacterium]